VSEHEYTKEQLEAFLEEAHKELDFMSEALVEAVKLQCHYAMLLNQYDGGHRTPFASVADFLARLDELRRAGEG
jgi:hypothetical protein